MAVAGLLVVSGDSGLAQRLWPGDSLREPATHAPSYDGRFMFARVKYTSGPGGYYYRGLPAWAHGYVPSSEGDRAELNLTRILKEVSYLNPHIDESGVFALDDPELFKYPIAYLTEPGFWTMSDQEAAGLRAYLLKGGFIIFDDFRTFHNQNLFDQMQHVLPEAVWQPLDLSHPIFHSFFEIKTLDVDSYYGHAQWLGIFEDNDPQKRLIAVANSNHDLGEYWEFSDTGYMPVDLSNDAYKFGVNYVVYGMTH